MTGEERAARIEQQAREKVAGRTLEQLIGDFEYTEEVRRSNALFTVRGWILDELERRDGEAFERWLDEGYSESPRKFFLKRG